MLITGLSNNNYPENRNLHNSTTVQNKLSLSGIDQDSVTLSPEAREEFEKLAAYPGWAGEYLPKVNVLNNPDAHKTGYSAWATSFRDTHRSELNEYNSKFRDYYQEAKTEHGIVTKDDHYTQVIAAKDENPAFKQTFESKISRDPRMLELMNILGIKQPG